MTVARLNSGGNITTGITNRLCTAGYLEVKPSTQYTINAIPETSGKTLQAYIVGYSESGSETAIANYPANAWYSFPITFTTGSNCRFIRISYRYSDDSTMATTSATNQQLELGSTATTYEAFWQIELCKIGTYQDSIYKSGGKWYVHKAVEKITFNGSESWTLRTTKTNTCVFSHGAQAVFPSGQYYSDRFLYPFPSGDVEGLSLLEATFYMAVSKTKASTVASLESWLASNNTTVYYALATPTDTEITNQALVEQLEALLNTARTYAGINNIFTITPNEQGTLEIQYYTKWQNTSPAILSANGRNGTGNFKQVRRIGTK